MYILFDYYKSIILDIIYSVVCIVLQFYHDRKQIKYKFGIFVCDNILTEAQFCLSAHWVNNLWEVIYFGYIFGYLPMI